MKIIVLLHLLALFLFADKIIVTADHFEAYENKKVSILTGHVHIRKNRDDIKADKLVIDFNTANKPIRYTLSGHVTFDITTSKQHFVGSAREIVYDPARKRYIATGNVRIKEMVGDRLLEGEKIVIDRVSGKSIITGTKNRPVKFIFSVQE